MLETLTSLLTLRLTSLCLVSTFSPFEAPCPPPPEGVVFSCQPRGSDAFALTLKNTGSQLFFYSIGLYGANTPVSDGKHYTCLCPHIQDNTDCGSMASYAMPSLGTGQSVTYRYQLPKSITYKYVRFKVSWRAASGSVHRDFFTQRYTINKS